MKIHRSISGGAAFAAAVLVFAVLAAVSGAGAWLVQAVNAQEVSVPEDFEISLMTSPLRARSEEDVNSVTITASGAGIVSSQKWRTDQPPQTEFDLTAGQVADLYRTVQEADFFSLDERYVDENVLDGDIATLTVTAGGETHTVSTINIAVEPFDRVALKINEFLPPRHKVFYNAIYDRLASEETEQ